MLNSFLDKYIFTGGLKYVHNNFFLMGIPFVIFPSSLLACIVEKNDKAIHREIYYSVKHAMADSIKNQFGVDFEKEGDKGLFLLEEMFTAFGWGAIKQIDVSREKFHAIVVCNNSPVALQLAGHSKLPVDHFLRGILAGIFSVYFGQDVECVEAKCSALNENSCEFVVKKKEEFDFSKGPAQSQLDTDR